MNSNIADASQDELINLIYHHLKDNGYKKAANVLRKYTPQVQICLFMCVWERECMPIDQETVLLHAFWNVKIIQNKAFQTLTLEQSNLIRCIYVNVTSLFTLVFITSEHTEITVYHWHYCKISINHNAFVKTVLTVCMRWIWLEWKRQAF